MVNLPDHIAIIPDGNRRWADLKGLTSMEGHLAGANRMHDTIAELIDLKVKYLTIWAFSVDNWKRSEEEITYIFRLVEEWIEKEVPWLHEKEVRLRHIGGLYKLPISLQQAIKRAVVITEHNAGMTFNLAFNYSGRSELVDAVRRIMMTNLNVRELTEAVFGCYLDTGGLPDVDLVIRTADEFRISNFMLWQTAYSEYYFTDVLWPDFDENELGKALHVYSQRQRRFGGD